MNALILAGGRGTRLRSMVADRPKSMAEISGKPFLELQIEYLKSFGIDRFIVCVGYLHETIIDYFGDGGRWGVDIQYSVEHQALGTGGAVRLAANRLRDTFLVFNGDTHFDCDIRAFLRFHEEQSSAESDVVGSIALAQVTNAAEFGSVEVDRDGRILAFDEKLKNRVGERYVNAGTYALEPEFVRHIPGAGKVSLERECFPQALDKGLKLCGYATAGRFIDIGTPGGYRKYREHVEGRQV